ncbi:P24 oleosin-like [Abrus precatorius]|uniref:P24 oleosin-like n=1 Tax=Abrus precatorius TaxID=3816 RepID=A0A8B8L7B2_ABRPR|nr:P24 oleosin-like [Abrus precatorius]
MTTQAQAQAQAQPHQIQVHTTTHRYETGVTPPRYEGGVALPRYEGGVNTTLYPEGKGPSTSQVLAVIAGLPLGGTLLILAGLTLAGTLTGLAVTTPLFILCSPVLVPATIVIGLAVAGFLTSGACGLTALSSFSWVLNYIRQTQGTVPEQLEAAKQKMADAAGYVGQKTKEVGQKTKEVGQDIQNKAQDTKRTTTTTTI